MKTENPISADTAPCCRPATGCASAAKPESTAVAPPLAGLGKIFRIATMDCSAEESEIRRALEPIRNIRSLGFQLGARTLRIDADEDAYPLALAAI